MDGQIFPPIGSLGERKAHTLRGSSKARPVGLSLPRDLEQRFPSILLLEGAPDLLAGYHFCLHLKSCTRGRFLPVAILGAGCKGVQQTLPHLFAGKFVRIVPHQDGDGTGLRAARNWECWLVEAGIEGDIFDLRGLRRRDGRFVKDLNDCTDLHSEHASEMEELFK